VDIRSEASGAKPTFTLEKLYVDLPQLHERSWRAYGLALALVALATVARMALEPWLGGVPFITLFPAVIVTTFLCGMSAGFFAAALATLSAWYFILPPVFSFRLEESASAVALSFFAMVASVDVVLVGALRNAAGRLRGFNATLAAVFDANPDAVFVTDRSGRIVNLNDRAAALFGYDREALKRETIESLLPERFRALHVGQRHGFFGAPRLREMGTGLALFGRRRDGGEFPVDVQIGPIQLAQETFVIATVRDMTQHRAAAEALAESRRRQAILEERQRGAEELRRWADAFDAAAFGIAIDDGARGTIRFANRAFAAMRQMTVAEVRGTPIADLCPPEERERLARLIAAADRTGHVGFESRHLRKDGTTFPVQMDMTSVRGPDGTVAYRIASVLDITERKKTEDALRQAQKMEAVGNVAGGMAHDFNNLLGIIIANLDFAAPLVAQNREAKEMIDVALDASLRGAELTRRLLAFARCQPLRPVRVQPNELVSGMARLLGRVLGANIEVALDLAPDLWPVVVDPAQLEASIANLATNSRDAMPKGGKLTIVTANRTLDADDAMPDREVAPGDYVLIEVTDSGSGMTPEVMKKIFEPFFTTKEVGKGTGLGLSMVFGFAKQSGGHVSVYSEPGIGTTFRLYLPRAPLEAAAAAAPAAIAPAESRGETVLVVEDNVGLRRVVMRQLAGLGYRVIEAESAQAALSVLEAGPVQLLFSDVVMPGDMDGFELARRTLQRWPATKVLLTSGFPGGKVNSDFGPLAASIRLLDKPYRKEDLARAVRDVLDG
jgi:PAS domain S-box-containing protein